MSGPDTPTKDLLSEPQDNSLPALQLANIVVKDKLGVGGFGAVYVGYHELMQRNVAIKVLKNSSGSTNWQLRFQREAQALSKLSHQNIVQVYSFTVTASEQAVLVMEYLEGNNLQDIVDKEGPLAPERAVSITKSICEAMQCAHDQAILHRDLKPSNIFITANGQVKVLDFGVAKLLEPSTSDQKLTNTGQFVGTPAYMSPEECAGKPAGTASDIYAIGCILYFMLVGETIFSANSDIEVMLKHCKETPKLKRLALSDDLIRILGTALNKDPSLRFSNCTALNEALSSDTISLTRKAPIIAGSHPLQIGMLAVGALVIVTTSLIFYFNLGRKEASQAVSHRKVDEWIESAWKLIQKDPEKALTLLQKANSTSGISDQQRWLIYLRLAAVLPTAEQRVENARRMVELTENPQTKLSRTERNNRRILSILTVAENSQDRVEIDGALAKAFALLSELDKSRADAESYKLWSGFYRTKVKYLQDKGDIVSAHAIAVESFNRLNEPIFHPDVNLATFYSKAIDLARSLGDTQSEVLFRQRLKTTFLSATSENLDVAESILDMLNTSFDRKTDSEKLKFLRNLRTELASYVSGESLARLNIRILKCLVETPGTGGSDPLTGSERSEIKRSLEPDRLSNASDADKKKILRINAVLIASEFNKRGTQFALQSLTEILESDRLGDPLKLFMIVSVLDEIAKRPQSLTPAFKSSLEDSFLRSSERIFGSNSKIKDPEDWETINWCIEFVEGVLANSGSIFFSESFSERMHALCSASTNLREIAKIAILNWVGLAHAEGSKISSPRLKALSTELVRRTTEIEALKGSFEAAIVLRCRFTYGLLYEQQNDIPDSLSLNDEITRIIEKKNYFEDPEIRAIVIRSWIARKSHFLIKENIPVPIERVDHYLDELQTVAVQLLLSGDDNVTCAIQSAIDIYAFTGDIKHAKQVANRYSSLAARPKILPKIKIGLLCLIPKASLLNRALLPSSAQASLLKDEFLNELSRAGTNPSVMLGHQSPIIKSAEAMGTVINASGGGDLESVRFTRDVLKRLRSFPAYLDKLNEWKLLDLINDFDIAYRKTHTDGLMTAHERQRYEELPNELKKLGINYYAYWHNKADWNY